jgi:DNA repair exonuclease SbcCD ATPase subunit
MIRAKSITIKEFRGVRDLTINFDEKNFAICGPNGTGKSGIVDALEFALTGDVSRLSGRGTGSVSLKAHGPHVDSRNYPDKATVILVVSIPQLEKDVTIERSVASASAPKITPNDADVLEVLNEVALHPEFVLSRRELIQYVLSAPAERAKQIQALLRLDDIETLRGTLLKISNAKEKEVLPLKKAKAHAQEQLQLALEITDLSKDKLLAAANARRRVLTLPPIPDLTATTSISDGLAVMPVAASARIPKTQALVDIKKLKDGIARIEEEQNRQSIEAIAMRMDVLNADPTIANGVSHL